MKEYSFCKNLRFRNLHFVTRKQEKVLHQSAVPEFLASFLLNQLKMSYQDF